MPIAFRLPRAATALVLLGLLGSGAAGAVDAPLRTAVDANFPPHAFTRLDGTLDGFQIDLGAALSRVLHRPVEVEGGNFAGLIPAMNAGRYDFLLAPVTATKERAENMLFTEGYLFTAFQFGIHKGATPITALDQLSPRPPTSCAAAAGRWNWTFGGGSPGGWPASRWRCCDCPAGGW